METEREIASELGEDCLSVAAAREMLLAGDAEAAAAGEGEDEKAAEAASQGGPAPEDAGVDAAAVEEPDDRVLFEGAVGLGVDIVEIARMEAILARNKAFARRVFSADEREYCDKRANAAAHYAVRFAAKEAVVKALGTGFSEGIGVRDIEVVRDKRGKPTVALSGRAREIADEQGVRELSISLSYTHVEAVACAMALTESAVRATEKRKDPMEELSRQFKDLRGMLDEL